MLDEQKKLIQEQHRLQDRQEKRIPSAVKSRRLGACEQISQEQ